MRKFTKAVFLILVLSTPLFSQYDGDSSQTYLLPVVKQNSISTVFNKELSIYSLTTNIDYSLAAGRFNFNLTEKLHASLLKYSGTNTTRDENVLRLSGDYRVNNYFNPGALVSSKFYSDSRTTDINTAASNFGILYNRSLIENLVNILPFGGYIEDVQSGLSNNGAIYGIQGGIDRTLFSEFLISSNFIFRNEDISPRKNTLREFTATVENFIDPGIQNRVFVNYHESGRDFFYDSDSLLQNIFLIEKNLQRRNNRIFSFSDEFNYHNVLENTSINFKVNFSDRIVARTTQYKLPNDLFPTSFDSQIEELKFDLAGGINYTSESMDIKFISSFAERNEKFLLLNPENSNPDYFEQRQKNEGIKNNVASQVFLTLSSIFLISNYDRMDLSLSHFKLRYDTPSSENIDERDELLSQLRLRYTRQLNANLSLFAGFDFSYGKLVYILAARSSNNNTNRIFRLNTGYAFTGRRLKNYGTFEILANYMVYDFEDLNPGFKSFSFRQISLVDSAVVVLTKELNFEFSGFYKLSEQGDLKWNDYRIKPSREITELLLLPALSTSLGRFSFKIGLRYYSYFSDVIINGQKKEENYYKGIAPSQR
ncbi:MAG: hypothetical protein IPJ75_08955 [Ignavibacteriales bacterium]|nr:hypothetical protein [Ignavibacteriales bacterium]